MSVRGNISKIITGFLSVVLTGGTVFAIDSTAVTASPGCGGYVRFIHGDPFRDQSVSIRVNGVQVVNDLPFRGVSDYLLRPQGPARVEFINARSNRVLETKSFVVGPNVGYTVLVGGPAKGPEGMPYGNTSPFVLIDDITPVTNPNRWKGTWYRMSETDVVIDLRVSSGQAKDVWAPEAELARLREKPNRSSYQLGDFPAGVYQFNPVGVGANAPFFNDALVPPRNVELRSVEIAGGETFDVIALGNFLGRAPNSLDLTSKRYRSELSEAGCYQITAQR
jgi:hypothetical protein